MTKSPALPTRQQLAEQFSAFIRTRGGWATIRYRSGIPIICASRSDCRTTSCQATSKGSASNFGPVDPIDASRPLGDDRNHPGRQRTTASPARWYRRHLRLRNPVAGDRRTEGLTITGSSASCATNEPTTEFSPPPTERRMYPGNRRHSETGSCPPHQRARAPGQNRARTAQYGY